MMINRYFTYNEIRIPGIQPRIRIEYFSFERQTMNNEKAKESNGRTKDEQKSNNNKINRTAIIK
jgi:hypothetical protein